VVNAALDGSGNTGGELGGDFLKSGGDLGGEGLGKGGGGIVLGLEGGLDLRDNTSLDGEVGLSVEGGDDTVNLVDQVLDGASEGESVRVGEVRAAVDGVDGRVDGRDEGVGSILDAADVATTVAVDGGAESSDLLSDASDELVRGGLALGGGSNGSGGQSQSEQAGELHGAGGCCCGEGGD
jgi:hypothetical protein